MRFMRRDVTKVISKDKSRYKHFGPKGGLKGVGVQG